MRRRVASWAMGTVSSGSGPRTARKGQSIEVATGEGDLVHIRSTDGPDNIVTTTVAKWKAFVLGVQNDEFDHFVDDGPKSP
jgi:hypothetical protein